MLRGVSHKLAAIIAAISLAGTAYAAPGDILLADNFDDDPGCVLGPIWTISDTNLAGGSNQTSNSGTCSGFTRGDAVTMTAPTIDLSSVIGSNLTLWVRRGSDAFSEDPDTINENFAVEFLDSTNTWVALTTEAGNGTAGEIFNLDFDLPLSALHSGFQLRFRQTGGSGGPPANNGIGWDYWHIDDVLLVETGTAPPPPLPSGMGVGLCERFESGFGNWSTTDATRSGINSDTFQSVSNSMFLRHDTVTTTSNSFDSDNLEEIEVWVRRGSDTFSENPEGVENLVFEYLNAANAWITLETFAGTGTQGEIFAQTYTIPPTDWHANFRVRFRFTTGSGSDFDYWHVDDLCFNRAQPDFTVTKSVTIEQDPINGTANPLSIPGAWAVYAIEVTNNGLGSADVGTIAIGDVIDPTLSLFTGNFDGSGSPFRFTDGTGGNASGLSLNFTTLGDLSDGVSFQDAGGTNIVPDGSFDPNVGRFDLQFDGPMNGATGGTTPTFTIEYRAQIN